MGKDKDEYYYHIYIPGIRINFMNNKIIKFQTLIKFYDYDKVKGYTIQMLIICLVYDHCTYNMSTSSSVIYSSWYTGTKPSSLFVHGPDGIIPFPSY